MKDEPALEQPSFDDYRHAEDAPEPAEKFDPSEDYDLGGWPWSQRFPNGAEL